MSENKQPLDKQDENADPITTGQPYARSLDTSTGAELPRNENASTMTPQPDAQPADTGMSTGLSRALIGGLIGATLGTLAGALANKRTAEGVNHVAKGVGVAVKSVAEGVNHAAKGVGVAVKSVAEGVNHAVIGGAVDASKDIAEGVKSSVTGVLDTVKDIAEDTKQSVVGVDALKGASDVKPSEHQSLKLEQPLVALSKQVTTGSVGIREQVETQTAEISVPVNNEQVVVEPTTPVDAPNASNPW